MLCVANMARSDINSRERILVIGAAGHMCRYVVQRFAPATDAALVLADINMEPVEALIAQLPKGQATTLHLDLYDHGTLLNAMKDVTLVVLAAGPYLKTCQPVLAACLEAKVPYLDFDDDIESTLSALDLHDEAKMVGVPCYIGCGKLHSLQSTREPTSHTERITGASPGMTNVMAVDAISQLDEVTSLDVAWHVGQEPSFGKAVLEHTMHIAAGPCLTWEAGKPALHETYLETAYAPMLGRTSEVLMHETAHPEPITLPRRFPQASRIRCLGGLAPQPRWGNARGFASAVRRGHIDVGEAVDFLYDMRRGALPRSVWGNILREFDEQTEGKLERTAEMTQLMADAGNSTGPWRWAAHGLVEQVKSGECTKEEVVDYLLAPGRVDQGEPFQSSPSSLLVRAVGMRKGHLAVVIKRTPTPGKDAVLMKTLGSMTGTACAAFILLALETPMTGGVYAPEDWAEPQAFYRALERLGIARSEIIEDY